MPSVLIATPYFYGKRYCFDEFLESLNSLSYSKDDLKFLLIDNSPLGKLLPEDYLHRKLPGLDWDLFYLCSVNRRFNSREVLGYCYSVALCYAEGYRFDYMLILECDVMIPSNGLILLLETSARYPGLICPITYRANGTHLQAYKDDMTLWEKKGKDGLYRIHRTALTDEDTRDKDIVRIGSATFSCLLIPSKFFQFLKINWYVDHYNHPDGFFYDLVKSYNIPVWLDTRVKCKHLQRPWKLGEEVVW